MEIKNRRIHISGSANAGCDLGKLRYAHSLIAFLAHQFILEGCSICLQVGKFPNHRDDKTLSIIFDWTIIDVIYKAIQEGLLPKQGSYIRPITTLITDKTALHIPEEKREIWEFLLQGDYVELLPHPRGWTSGAVRREGLSNVGDILILLSGGEGGEHSTNLYLQQGKPVIPYDIDIGAITEEGTGRAVGINKKINSNPKDYLQFTDSIGALLENCSTQNCQRPVQEVVKNTLNLINHLDSPMAFCVRLLDQELESFPDVEKFFNEIVSPLMVDRDYKLITSPNLPSKTQWMNEQIFNSIHRSSLVIVDLTNLRPNCLIELGYALGRNHRVLITARKGTVLPFDIDKIESFFWSLDDIILLKQNFNEYIARRLKAPSLVPNRLYP